MIRSKTGTSNEVGDAERPNSIRKVTRPVSATAPPGRRPLIMIHPAKSRDPSSPISVSAGGGGPTSKSAAEFFSDWVADGGGAFGDEGASFFSVENSYWAARNEPRMLLVHFNDLKAERDREMRRIAEFLNIDIPANLWAELLTSR